MSEVDLKGTGVPTLVFGEVLEEKEPLAEKETSKKLQQTRDETILSDEV